MLNFVAVYSAVPCAFILICVLALRWFLVPEDCKRTEWMLAATALAIPANQMSEFIAGSLSRLRPLKYDLFVYRLDGFVGQPSFVIGRTVERHLSLKVLVSVTYGFLPIMLLGVFGIYLWLRSEAEALTTIKAFALNLFLSVPFYLAFPVCGPAFAFKDFPFHEPHLTPHPIFIAAPPNGVPSVHMSSALLILWFFWQWPLGRTAGIIFLALTIIATLGSGQHYAFDLLCAVPYAIAIVWIAAGRPTQIRREAVSEARITS